MFQHQRKTPGRPSTGIFRNGPISQSPLPGIPLQGEAPSAREVATPVGRRRLEGEGHEDEAGVWQRFYEVGALDEESIEQKLKEDLMNQLQSKENELKRYQFEMGKVLLENTNLRDELVAAELAAKDRELRLEAEQNEHREMVAQMRTREQQLHKSVEAERRCTADLERAVREMQNESMEAKKKAEVQMEESMALWKEAERKRQEAEAQVRSAQALHREAEQKMGEIRRREEDVAAREREVNREHAKRLAEFEAEKAEVDRRQREVASWDASLKECDGKLKEAQQRLRQLEKSLEERSASILSNEKALEHRDSVLRAREENAKYKEEEVKAWEIERRAWIEALEEKLAVQQLNTEKWAAEVGARERAVVEAGDRLAVAEADVTQRSGELVQAQAEMAREHERLTELSTRLLSDEAGLASQILKHDSDWEQRHSHLRTLESEIEKKLAEAERAKESAVAREESLTVALSDEQRRRAEITAARSACEAAQAQLQEKEENLRKREEAVERKSENMDKKLEKVKEKERDLGERERALRAQKKAVELDRQSLEEAGRASMKDKADIEDLLEELEGKRAEFALEVDGLQTQKHALEEDKAALERENAEKLAGLQGELEKLKEEGEELAKIRQNLEAEREELKAERTRFEDKWVVLDQREKELAEMEERLAGEVKSERLQLQEERVGMEQAVRDAEARATEAERAAAARVEQVEAAAKMEMEKERVAERELMDRQRAAELLKLEESGEKYRKDLEVEFATKLEEARLQMLQETVAEADKRMDKAMEEKAVEIDALRTQLANVEVMLKEKVEALERAEAALEEGRHEVREMRAEMAKKVAEAEEEKRVAANAEGLAVVERKELEKEREALEEQRRKVMAEAHAEAAVIVATKVVEVQKNLESARMALLKEVEDLKRQAKEDLDKEREVLACARASAQEMKVRENAVETEHAKVKAALEKLRFERSKLVALKEELQAHQAQQLAGAVATGEIDGMHLPNVDAEAVYLHGGEPDAALLTPLAASQPMDAVGEKERAMDVAGKRAEGSVERFNQMRSPPLFSPGGTINWLQQCTRGFFTPKKNGDEQSPAEPEAQADAVDDNHNEEDQRMMVSCPVQGRSGSSGSLRRKTTIEVTVAEAALFLGSGGTASTHDGLPQEQGHAEAETASGCKERQDVRPIPRTRTISETIEEGRRFLGLDAAAADDEDDDDMRVSMEMVMGPSVGAPLETVEEVDEEGEGAEQLGIELSAADLVAVRESGMPMEGERRGEDSDAITSAAKSALRVTKRTRSMRDVVDEGRKFVGISTDATDADDTTQIPLSGRTRRSSKPTAAASMDNALELEASGPVSSAAAEGPIGNRLRRSNRPADHIKGGIDTDSETPSMQPVGVGVSVNRRSRRSNRPTEHTKAGPDTDSEAPSILQPGEESAQGSRRLRQRRHSMADYSKGNTDSESEGMRPRKSRRFSTIGPSETPAMSADTATAHGSRYNLRKSKRFVWMDGCVIAGRHRSSGHTDVESESEATSAHAEATSPPKALD